MCMPQFLTQRRGEHKSYIWCCCYILGSRKYILLLQFCNRPSGKRPHTFKYDMGGPIKKFHEHIHLLAGGWMVYKTLIHLINEAKNVYSNLFINIWWWLLLGSSSLFFIQLLVFFHMPFRGQGNWKWMGFVSECSSLNNYFVRNYWLLFVLNVMEVQTSGVSLYNLFSSLFLSLALAPCF